MGHLFLLLVVDVSEHVQDRLRVGKGHGACFAEGYVSFDSEDGHELTNFRHD
jgi:hypothetical protein